MTEEQATDIEDKCISCRRAAAVSAADTSQTWCVVKLYKDNGDFTYREWSLTSLHNEQERGHLRFELVASYRLGELA